MNLLVLLKWLISRFTLIPNYCKRCGRETEPFYVPDALWQDIADDPDKEYCFRCFSKMGESKGMLMPKLTFTEG